MGMAFWEDSEKWSKRLRGLNQQRGSKPILSVTARSNTGLQECCSSLSQRARAGICDQEGPEEEAWPLPGGVEVWRPAMENRNSRACELATMMRRLKVGGEDRQ